MRSAQGVFAFVAVLLGVFVVYMSFASWVFRMLSWRRYQLEREIEQARDHAGGYLIFDPSRGNPPRASRPAPEPTATEPAFGDTSA